MAVVFSFGGSIFTDKKLLDKYIKYFKQLSKKQLVGIVVGGGKLCRGYIKQIKKKTDNEVIQHLMGILATRQNAQKMCDILEDTNPIPALDYEEALEYSAMFPIVVMGGAAPYMTTDSCSVILAELLEAKKVINLTDVDYLYDKDPKKHKNAKKILKMNKKDFLEFVLKNDKRRPGEHFVIDSIAAFILQKTKKTSLYILNGKNLTEVKKAVSGRKFKGTVIK